MPFNNEKRIPNQPEEAQIRGAAQRLMREGKSMQEASFREMDKPEFIEGVRRHGQAIFVASEKAVPTEAQSAETAETKRELTPEQQAEIFASLEVRFSKQPDYYKRSEGIDFAEVKKALEADPAKLWSLAQMESTGGTPDIIAIENNEFVFADCSAESPKGRRNCVYDKEAEKKARGKFDGNAVDMATAMGVDIMDGSTYKQILQKLGKFDLNTWSWLKTPQNIRDDGVAFDGSRNGDEVFAGRSGVKRYCVGGAWRGVLRVKKV